MLQRNVDATVLEIMQDRVALAKSPARGVLTREPHAHAFGRQGRKGERLGRGPVERTFALRHVSPQANGALDFRVRLKILGKMGLNFQQSGKPLLLDSRVDLLGVALTAPIITLPYAAEGLRPRNVLLVAG